MRRFALLFAVALLAGCKPNLQALGIAGRTITINNLSNGDVLVNRVIANGQDGREECVQIVGETLRPGQSRTVTFFNCGRVDRVTVDSDQGAIDLQVEDDSAPIGNAAG